MPNIPPDAPPDAELTHDDTLLMKSDKGHTAHEYAAFCGHAEVAAYLRDAERSTGGREAHARR